VTGSGSTNPLRYGGIVQSAEKFADLSQRFISRLPDHPHGYIPGLQAPFAARNQTLSIHMVFFGYSLQYSVRLNGVTFVIRPRNTARCDPMGVKSRTGFTASLAAHSVQV